MKTTFLKWTLPLVLPFSAIAQEDSLLTSLETGQTRTKTFTTSAFKGTRLINNYTVECLGKNNLEFRVGHRFGDVATGEETFYGLDNANMNITLDYGIFNNLTVGIGRNSLQKLYEGVIKFKALKQTDNNSMPITLVLLTKANVLSNTKGAQYDDPVNAWSYVSEIIIARKFNKMLSLQLSPTYVHLNLVPTEFINNDIFALTGAGRFKFTRSVAFTAEYTQTLNNYYDKEVASYVPVFSAGFDLETGGHVFQLFFSNANSLNETQFIPFNSSDWGRNQYRFGFNISRVFGFGKSKATTKSTY